MLQKERIILVRKKIFLAERRIILVEKKDGPEVSFLFLYNKIIDFVAETFRSIQLIYTPGPNKPQNKLLSREKVSNDLLPPLLTKAPCFNPGEVVVDLLVVFFGGFLFSRGRVILIDTHVV